MFIIDTNVVSELRRPRPHGAVTTWMNTLQPSQLNIAGVTVGEIQIGIERTRQDDPGKALEIERWLIETIQAVTVVPMTGDTFRIWAKLMHKAPPHLSGDAMIAATAIQHGLTIATRNTRDFEQFAVPLFNPFL